MNEKYDLVIVGNGAAGLSAAIYAGRYTMRVLVIGEKFGGETATAGTIWNYPGVKGIDGFELMKVMKEQAEELEVDFKDGRVTNIEKTEGGCFAVHVKDEQVLATTVVLAIGTERRRLGLPNEDELTGKGVHYCITCDGPLYAGKTVIVVGGGDGSVKGINLVAEYAEKIYLVARNKQLRAEPINLEHMEALGDKVTVIYENVVEEIIGQDRFEKVILRDEFNGNKELAADGLFVEIGANPNSDLAKNLGAELDEWEYAKVDNMMKTNVDGLFVAGDATNHFGSFKQDITAAATGAVAATSAYNYKKVNGDLCEKHWKSRGAKKEE